MATETQLSFMNGIIVFIMIYLQEMLNPHSCDLIICKSLWKYSRSKVVVAAGQE
jgi:hypothetical protein